jgi:hypothetical protein
MNVEREEFRVEEMHHMPVLVPSLHQSCFLSENMFGELPQNPAVPSCAIPPGT